MPLIRLLAVALIVLNLGACWKQALAENSLQLYGVNYYPQDTPWSLFWPRFNPQVIAQDFSRIRALGFRDVRIFIPYTVFGGSRLNPEMHQHLKQLLQIAQKQRLKVVITLFDFYTDYARPEEARQHLRQLVAGLQQHPAIAAWDLKNESDRDQPAYAVEAWLHTMAKELRQLGVKQPITASASQPEAAARASASLDYVTFHYYGREEDFSKRVRALKAKTSKPVVLGEVGFHTWNAGTDPHFPEHQFNYLQALMAGVLAERLHGVMIWNLYDYAPQLREKWVLTHEGFQQHLGLIGTNGVSKPGLKALRQGVFLRDAQTHRAVGAQTQEIELWVQSRRPQTLTLERWRGSQRMASQQREVPAGVSSWRWRIDPQTLSAVLSWQERYILQSPAGMGLGGDSLPSQQALLLRLR